MLGYSSAMHKHATLLAALLCTTSAIAGSARAQPQATVAVPPPRSATPAVPVPMPGSEVRQAFDAAARGNLDPALLAAHRHQPLRGWIEFTALRRDLAALPVERGEEFLRRHGSQPVGDAFRAEWLPALGKRGEWQALLSAWRDGIESPALRCLQLQARHQLGRDDAAWVREAQAIWRSSGKSLPDSCDAVFAQLAAQGALDDALRWQRFDLAADAQQAGVMRAIGRGMASPENTRLATTYAAYMDAADASAGNWPKTARSRLVAAAALAKLGKAAPDRAEALLPAVAQALGFGEAERGRVLYQVALWTVASYLPGSAQRMAAVPLAAYDTNLHEWQAREAMARSDWVAALAAIRRMPQAQRDDSRWQYFAARTSELTGDAAGARALYAQAARKSDFHGVLAADRLGQPYTLCPWQPIVANADKREVARDAALVRALQLFALDRKGWAVLEWNDALSRFSDEQRRIAVEVAQDNGWFDRAVFGLVNVGGKSYPDERNLYHLRFPLHQDASIRREARRHNLDPAWVAEEIRAESVFDPNARSPADARGLMQVLPATAAGVAARIGMPWRGGDSLYEPDTNIALGTAYLRQLMDQYGGKPYQVIAGYNAGPAPRERWQSQRPAMDPDFWIETISYRETREYVARVLSFSTIYDWRLNGNALKVSDRMLGNVAGIRQNFVCPASAPRPLPRQPGQRQH